jgi:hypothetical protein
MEAVIISWPRIIVRLGLIATLVDVEKEQAQALPLGPVVKTHRFPSIKIRQSLPLPRPTLPPHALRRSHQSKWVCSPRCS